MVTGLNGINIADFRVNALKDFQKIRKILFRYLSFCPEYFIQPVIFVDHIRFAQKILVFIPENGILFIGGCYAAGLTRGSTGICKNTGYQPC